MKMVKLSDFYPYDRNKGGIQELHHKIESKTLQYWGEDMGRRIPKQAITGFKFQNETDNIRPFLSIRIRGKDEIIPFKDKKEIQSVKAHLCSIFSGFVKIGDWYLKMSEVKEYKPVTAEDMNPYILFKTSKFGNIKVRFPKDEDMNAELLVLDQLFDVE